MTNEEASLQDWRDAFIRRLAPRVMRLYGFRREEAIERLCKLSNEGLKRFSHKIKWQEFRLRRGIVPPEAPKIKDGRMQVYALRLPAHLALALQMAQLDSGSKPSDIFREALAKWLEEKKNAEHNPVLPVPNELFQDEPC